MLNANHLNPPLKTILNLFMNINDEELIRVPARGPLILVTNHINSLDAPVGFSHLHPRPLTAFVKAETWKNPLLSVLFTAWDTIPLHRGELDIDAFKRGENALKQGKILVVAPEGTRSYSGQLNEGYPGVVYLALRTNAPIQPVVFFGNENFASRLRTFQKTDMVIKVGRTFRLRSDTTRPDRETRKIMTDEIMYEIARILPEKNRGIYHDLSRSKQEYLDFKGTQ
jgi:1-acyl-sn-glycerol-3-phosphate acyltransferase